MSKVLSTIFLIFTLGQAAAQAKTDTVQLAKQYRNKGKFKMASDLLGAYHAHYPKDINALWLYAQTEFWRRHFHRSQQLYEQGLMLQPDKDYLALDYAHSLLDMGNWRKADKIIGKMEKSGKTYSDLLYLRARVSYYQGDYKIARQEAITAIDSNTQSKTAKELYNDIMTARSPWISMGASYTSDDQPMQTVSPYIEAGVFLHRYASLQVGFYSPVFIRNGSVANSQLVSIGTTSSFSQADFLMKFDIGADKFPVQNNISWIGDVYLQKTFAQYLVFDALAERKPYLSTYSSIDSALSRGHFASSLGWSDQSFINGKIGFDLNYFADGNYVYSIYGYAYAPPIKFSIAELRFGYSYSYSSSKESDYVSTRPLDTIIKNFATNPSITGVYNPVFTPYKQQVHSILASLKLNPSRHVEIGVSGSLGFYAYTQDPYLYLDKNNDNQIYIARAYARESFIPGDAGAYLEWKFAKKYSIRADYRYRTTYFYSSHTAGLSFKMSIWKS